MSCQLLALRSGVSLPTVQRILRDGGEHATYASLAAVAQALGMDFELKDTCDEQTFAERQAETKARAIVRMVQGTSALESQAVDSDTYQQMVKQTVHELMAGPRRKTMEPDVSDWRPIPGETPIDPSGLRDRSITTRVELNRAEALNITKAYVKYLAAVPSKRMAPFDYAWLLRLHKEMFCDVWKWAGQPRQRT